MLRPGTGAVLENLAIFCATAFFARNAPHKRSIPAVAVLPRLFFDSPVRERRTKVSGSRQTLPNQRSFTTRHRT